MNIEQRELIIKTIVKNEKLRHISRFERILRNPVRTSYYYFLAAISHICPYKMTFPTLWHTEMTSYLPEGNTFYYYGYCEANLTSFLLRYLKEGDIVLDVGAHIGFYSMLTSKLVGTLGEVHSFEPTPWTFALLQKNTEHCSNVMLNNKAVSDKRESISFKDYGPGYGAYNTAHKDGSILKKKAVTIHTETVAIDVYCNEKSIKPTFIKLDAEGFEFTILGGMSYVLETIRPLITLEVAGGKEWSTNCKKSIDVLLSKKYIPYEMSVDGHIVKHVIKDSYTYDNLLFIPEEKI